MNFIDTYAEDQHLRFDRYWALIQYKYDSLPV